MVEILEVQILEREGLRDSKCNTSKFQGYISDKHSSNSVIRFFNDEPGRRMGEKLRITPYSRKRPARLRECACRWSCEWISWDLNDDFFLAKRVKVLIKKDNKKE